MSGNARQEIFRRTSGDDPRLAADAFVAQARAATSGRSPRNAIPQARRAVDRVRHERDAQRVTARFDAGGAGGVSSLWVGRG